MTCKHELKNINLDNRLAKLNFEYAYIFKRRALRQLLDEINMVLYKAFEFVAPLSNKQILKGDSIEDISSVEKLIEDSKNENTVDFLELIKLKKSLLKQYNETYTIKRFPE